jgi:hypothetical protein
MKRKTDNSEDEDEDDHDKGRRRGVQASGVGVSDEGRIQASGSRVVTQPPSRQTVRRRHFLINPLQPSTTGLWFFYYCYTPTA